MQYVAASVGGNASGGYSRRTYARMLVFAMGGTAKLPPNQEHLPPKIDPPASTAAADAIQPGG